MDDLEKEKMRQKEIAKVREWETYHPVQDFLYMILAMLICAFIFIAPVILVAYWIAQGLLDLLKLM